MVKEFQSPEREYPEWLNGDDNGAQPGCSLLWAGFKPWLLVRGLVLDLKSGPV